MKTIGRTSASKPLLRMPLGTAISVFCSISIVVVINQKVLVKPSVVACFVHNLILQKDMFLFSRIFNSRLN